MSPEDSSSVVPFCEALARFGIILRMFAFSADSAQDSLTD